MSSKKVHVLYILTKLELGGAQKVCLSLIEGLKKESNFAGLISGNQGVLIDQVKKYESVFLLDSFKREIGLKILFLELKTFFQIISRLRKLKKSFPDLIVHTHSTKAGILGRWAAFFARVKNRVHTVHGFGFHDYQSKFAWCIMYFLEYITAFITTHYVCVSYNDQKIGAKLFPKFLKKSSIIRAAVDWEQFYTASKTQCLVQNKFLIGSVSCFKPQKNLFDLLKAFKLAYASCPNIFLQIIGDGVLREPIENWIQENNMQDKIELLGWQNNVADFMKKWDLFAMSSLWEGLPCSIIEARLSKLPVLSYNIAGIPEVVIDGKNGFLVNSGDWRNLAEKIVLLAKDNNLKIRMQNSIDDLNSFQNNFMVSEHINLYKNLI
ncbi:glycosyltransferase [Candidatus Babeliales bacterium]|nr:glycosyltransferase [Candidatus Babeliales bacterium]MCF7899154.1 glycosyltransferase [Candidatus Babeliales bacterium]